MGGGWFPAYNDGTGVGMHLIEQILQFKTSEITEWGIKKKISIADELFIGVHGSESPTKVTFPFLIASGALDTVYKTTIVLVGDSVILLNGTIAENVHDVDLPPIKRTGIQDNLGQGRDYYCQC